MGTFFPRINTKALATQGAKGWMTKGVSPDEDGGHWATLKGGQHVYITGSGELDPDGPKGEESSKPTSPKIKPNATAEGIQTPKEQGEYGKFKPKKSAADMATSMLETSSIKDAITTARDFILRAESEGDVEGKGAYWRDVGEKLEEMKDEMPDDEDEQDPTSRDSSHLEADETFSMEGYKAADWVFEHEALTKVEADYRADVMQYTGAGYGVINDAMRQCPPDFDCLKGEIALTVNGIEEAIAEAPPFPEPLDLFRGIKLDDAKLEQLTEAMSRAAETGEEIGMPSITSTSVEPRVAMSFSVEGLYVGASPAVFKIKAKTGLSTKTLSTSKHEREFLQSSKTRYKVSKVSNVRFTDMLDYDQVVRVFELEEV